MKISRILLAVNKKIYIALIKAALLTGNIFVIFFSSANWKLSNRNPPTYSIFVNNSCTAFTPRKLTDRLKNYASITQHLKCIMNSFFCSHFKCIKGHSFPFILVYNTYITRIFCFCQRQKAFSIYRQLTVFVSSVIFVYKLASNLCTKSLTICFCRFETIFYIYLCIILHDYLHKFKLIRKIQQNPWRISSRVLFYHCIL